MFCKTRDLIRERVPLAGEDWGGLAKFIAVQLLRTPRSLRFLQGAMDDRGLAYGADAPQHVMLVMMQRAARRLGRMRGMIAYNKSNFPLLTCDNPVSTWRKVGHGFDSGVDLSVPDVVVSCPLAPDLMFVAHQTQESLKAILAEEEGDGPPD